MFFRNILLVIGLVALLGGAALTVLWVARTPAASVAPDAAKAERRSILIASHAIPAGTLLGSGDVAWKEIAAADVTQANLVLNQSSDADYIGAVSRRDFGEGEALVLAGLVKRNERGFLAAVLMAGMRAVSIAVDAPQSASGLVLPGDHVDVILTQSVGSTAAGGPSETVGETILRDLRIIAVDQSLSAAARPQAAENAPITGGMAAQLPKTVTLEVSDRDAEKLFVAGTLGKLDLAVRALENPAPSSSVASKPMWGSDVSAALRNPRQAAPQLAAPPSAPGAAQQPAAKNSTEVMHGAKIEAR